MIIGSDLGSTAMKYHPPGQPFTLENDMQVECRFHKGELHTVEKRLMRFPSSFEHVGLSCGCSCKLTGLKGYTKAEIDAIRREFPKTVRSMPGGLYQRLLNHFGNTAAVWRFAGVTT